MASLGFGRSKNKQSSSGSSEVNPYAPTVPYIDKILSEANREFEAGNKQFMGGFDYANNLFTDPTVQMDSIRGLGEDLYKGFQPDQFKDLQSTYSSYLNGDPTTSGGGYLDNFLTSRQTGTSLDDFNAGRGANAYGMMSTPSTSYLDELLGSTTNKITNRIGSEFAGMGRYGNSGAFSDAVGSGVSAEILPYMMEMAENERAREFTGNQDYIQNMYNAGANISDQLTTAGANLNNAEAQLLMNADNFNQGLYNLASGSLDSSYGYAGIPNQQQDVINEYDALKMSYDQDANLSRIMDFADLINAYAFGFPTKLTSGTTSGKGTQFGFSLGG